LIGIILHGISITEFDDNDTKLVDTDDERWTVAVAAA
jgi:hypothetical protein